MNIVHDFLRHALTGQGVWIPVLAFLLAGVVVFIVSSRLAAHADAIADATGLGRVWIGAVLLAASTSLPEVVTDTNAALLGTIDIGVGDLFGSTLANMLVLAGLDLAYARRRVLQHVALDHTLIGSLAIVLTAIATVAISARGLLDFGPIGLESLLILGVYLFGMHAVYRSIEVAPSPPQQMEFGENRRTILAAGLRGFALAAIGLMLVAPALVVSAEAIAIEAHISQTAVGTALVGFTTSFPEIAATIAAARLGAFDLAVGNIFGSNAFNMCVLPLMDVFYRRGPLLGSASTDHAISGEFAVLALALGVMGILARAERRIAVLRIESLLIIAAYGGALWLLVARGGT